MRPMTSFLLGALFAFAVSGVATAETPEASPISDPAAYSAIDGLELDDAFEKTAADGTDEFLARLGEPTTMDCSNGAVGADLETCVVTVPGPESAIPAALAQH